MGPDYEGGVHYDSFVLRIVGMMLEREEVCQVTFTVKRISQHVSGTPVGHLTHQEKFGCFHEREEVENDTHTHLFRTIYSFLMITAFI